MFGSRPVDGRCTARTAIIQDRGGARGFKQIRRPVLEKTCDAALADIEEYFRQYNKLGELGRGKFGTVFHVQQIENGKFFASKHIR